MRARETERVAASATGEEGFILGCVRSDGFVACGLRVDMVVIETLAYEHDVCYAEVDSECDDGGHKISPQSS